MKCYTIQDKSILNILMVKKIYYTYRLPRDDNLKTAYEFAKNIYNFKSTPIFLVPANGVPITVYGCTLNNSIGLELNIPDKYLKIQDYYNWVDIIYFLDKENRDEFYSVYNLNLYSNPEDMAKDVLLNSKISIERENQLMVEYLKYEWIVNIYDGLELCKMIDESTYNIAINMKGLN